jgi:hypothetical protein
MTDQGPASPRSRGPGDLDDRAGHPRRGELRVWARRLGSHDLADAPVRSRAVVRGTVRAIEPVAWAGGPVLEVALADGAHTIVLVFFGRHAIGGLSLGQAVTAAGTVGTHRGRRVILDPLIWLALTDQLPTAAVEGIAPLELIAVRRLESTRAGGTRARPRGRPGALPRTCRRASEGPGGAARRR